jgi:hypothetical protein
VYLETVRRQVRESGERARDRVLLTDYTQAMRIIQGRLSQDPADWGDPLYRLRQMNLVVCRGIHWAVLVEYVADESSRLAFVQKYRLLPENPRSP